MAEIWHSYLERNISLAVLTEKSRRLELELELNKLKEERKDEVFSPQEEKEFQFTKQEMGKCFSATVEVYLKRDPEGRNIYGSMGGDIFKIPTVHLFVALLQDGHSRIDGDLTDVRRAIITILTRAGYPDKAHDNARQYDYYQLSTKSNILTRLLTYGLLKPPIHSETETSITTYYYFSEKAFRFLYWLKYNGHDKHFPEIEFVKHVSEQERRRRMGFPA